MALNEKRDDISLLKIDVKSWDSEVAKQFGIQSLPHLQIYDGKGELMVAGGDAFKKLEKL